VLIIFYELKINGLEMIKKVIFLFLSQPTGSRVQCVRVSTEVFCSKKLIFV